MFFIDKLLRRTKLFKKIFDGKEGEEALKFLAEEAGAYRSSFVSNDPYTTAYNEGKRHMYSFIISIINQNEEVIRRAMQHDTEQLQVKSSTHYKV